MHTSSVWSLALRAWLSKWYSESEMLGDGQSGMRRVISCKLSTVILVCKAFALRIYRVRSSRCCNSFWSSRFLFPRYLSAFCRITRRSFRKIFASGVRIKYVVYMDVVYKCPYYEHVLYTCHCLQNNHISNRKSSKLSHTRVSFLMRYIECRANRYKLSIRRQRI